MPRLVRREPLVDRIKAYLDPYDFLLWLSEELHESAWDETLSDWTIPIGLGTNLIFVIARANSGGNSASAKDDVFGDFNRKGGSGWFSWLASFTVHFLALVAVVNALYTFMRKRSYRLFEASVEHAPSTPSARRVKVDSSPMSSSPLRYLSSVIIPTTAESRAYPDEKQDVWEVNVWDPKELNLELFTLFSPGHVLIYWLFLPTASVDPRPSVTVFTAILIGAMLSVQLVLLRRSFTQQTKDNRLIQKEVMNEYDTKYVHPTLNRPVRDVGVQTRDTATSPGARTREVDVYTPTTIINRGFKVNPNPSYTGHLGEDAEVMRPISALKLKHNDTPSALRTPLNGRSQSYSSFGGQTDRTADFTTPSKHYLPRERSPVKGDGGSLGVYSHAASPLKKAASSGYLRPGSTVDGAIGSSRIGSPLKRMSTPGDGERPVHRTSGLREHRRETGRF